MTGRGPAAASGTATGSGPAGRPHPVSRCRWSWGLLLPRPRPVGSATAPRCCSGSQCRWAHSASTTTHRGCGDPAAVRVTAGSRIRAGPRPGPGASEVDAGQLGHRALGPGPGLEPALRGPPARSASVPAGSDLGPGHPGGGHVVLAGPGARRPCRPGTRPRGWSPRAPGTPRPGRPQASARAWMKTWLAVMPPSTRSAPIGRPGVGLGRLQEVGAPVGHTLRARPAPARAGRCPGSAR